MSNDFDADLISRMQRGQDALDRSRKALSRMKRSTEVISTGHDSLKAASDELMRVGRERFDLQQKIIADLHDHRMKVLRLDLEKRGASGLSASIAAEKGIDGRQSGQLGSQSAVGDPVERDARELAALPGLSPAVQQGLDRTAMVNAFLFRCNREAQLGFKVMRRHVWQAAGHGGPRQFQYWQKNNAKATALDDLTLRRILGMSPTAFLALLKKKHITLTAKPR